MTQPDKVSLMRVVDVSTGCEFSQLMGYKVKSAEGLRIAQKDIEAKGGLDSIPLNTLLDISYTVADMNGWHPKGEGGFTFGDKIALIHSELSEALEEYRKGHTPREVYFQEDGKPEGIPTELADVLIRVLDLCGEYSIDIESAIHLKTGYNSSRGWRHGGKKL